MLKKPLLTLALCSLFAACGGGGGDPTDPPPAPAPSPGVSPPALAPAPVQPPPAPPPPPPAPAPAPAPVEPPASQPPQVAQGIGLFAGDDGGPGKADGTGRDARFRDPDAIAIAANGDLYVADTGNAQIRKVTPQGVVTTVATGVVALDLAVAPDGALYYLPSQPLGSLMRLPPGGFPEQVIAGDASRGDYVLSVAVARDGTVYASHPSRVERIGPGGARVTFSAQHDMRALTVAPNGRVYGIQDARLFVSLDRDGAPTVAAAFPVASPPAVTGLAVDANGNLRIAGSRRPAGQPGLLRGVKVEPDSGLPEGVPLVPPILLGGHELFAYGPGADAVFDARGNLYFTSGQGVGVLDVATGTISSLAGTLVGLPPGNASPIDAQLLAVDGAGEIWTVERTGAESRVRRHDARGQAIRWGPVGAGVPLPGTAPPTESPVRPDALVSRATGLVRDAAGNAFVSVATFKIVYVFGRPIEQPDSGALYRITAAGDRTLLRASAPGSQSFVPTGLSIDAAGNLYYLDLLDPRAHVHRRTPSGTDTVVAGGNASFTGDRQLAVNEAGRVWFVGGRTVYRTEADGGWVPLTITSVLPGGVVAERALTAPRAPVVLPSGDLLLVDEGVLLRIDATGRATELAGGASSQITPGPLPGSIGRPDAMARRPDGVIYLHSGGAILQVRLP